MIYPSVPDESALPNFTFATSVISILLFLVSPVKVVARLAKVVSTVFVYKAINLPLK